MDTATLKALYEDAKALELRFESLRSVSERHKAIHDRLINRTDRRLFRWWDAKKQDDGKADQLKAQRGIGKQFKDRAGKADGRDRPRAGYWRRR